GAFDFLRADEMSGLSLPYEPAARFQYSVLSFPSRVQEEERLARSLSYPQAITDQYLQLPELSPKVEALAQQVTVEARTPYERIVAIEGHLRSVYRYSLDVGTTIPVNPVEEFLFVRKTGYCEHYATAMVMMVRALGIPARLVTGFLPGEWNGFGRYYTIRQRDAHAWVEVYFPRSGWVTFDPTPSAPAAASIHVWAGAGRVIDSVRLKWDRFIIQYSLRDQIKMAQGIRDQSDKVRGRALGLVATIHRWVIGLQTWAGQLTRMRGLLWTVGLAGSLLLLLIAKAGLRRLRQRRHRPSELPTMRQAAVVRLYSRMLEMLATHGIVKTPGATALEFAGTIATKWADVGRYVAPLTELYCRVRFGQAPLSQEELEQAEALLNGLHHASRQGPTYEVPR
ncbi:MAG: transglutaminase domain-containing protein, partial [Nitrospirota bacterium]|nr:transglutaminase domain-containing protein [Nitrospirota bacterium]